MKRLDIRISLTADDQVSAEAARRLLVNQLWFLLGIADVQGGRIAWDRARVTVREDRGSA